MARQRGSQEEHVSQPEDSNPSVPTLLTVIGDEAKIDGKFDITDSIQIECEIGGELRVGGKLVIGENGVVHADVETVDCIVRGQYEGKMVATGSVEIATTGRVSGNLETDSLVIQKGGFFNGNVLRINESVDQASPSLSIVSEPPAAAAESAAAEAAAPEG